LVLHIWYVIFFASHAALPTRMLLCCITCCNIRTLVALRAGRRLRQAARTALRKAWLPSAHGGSHQAKPECAIHYRPPLGGAKTGLGLGAALTLAKTVMARSGPVKALNSHNGPKM
jgi:hypothetical protein